MTVNYPYIGMYGPMAVITALGVPVPSASVNVYLHGTMTPAALWTDQTATTSASNPVTTDGYGNLTFFAAPGLYDIAFTAGGVPTTLTVQVNRWYAEEAPFGSPGAQSTGVSGTAGTSTSTIPFGTGSLGFSTSGCTLTTTPYQGIEVPVGGKYLVSTGADIAMTAAGASYMNVLRNGGATLVEDTRTNGAAGTIQIYQRMTGLVICNANDIVGVSISASASFAYSAADLSVVLVSA